MRPLGLITTSVQALAGLLLPSASVFLLLLCNDREVLGPWVNPRWLNVVAAIIVGVLLVLSGTLMATTLFPSINVVRVFIDLTIALAAGGIIVMAVLWILAKRSGRPRVPPIPQMSHIEQALVAHATARPAQTSQVVSRTEGRHPLLARLPGPQRGALDRQGRPARRRMIAGPR